MDDRKKDIKALEGKKKEAQEAMHRILEQLGEILLVRMTEQEQPHIPETSEYCRLLQDIAESQTYIADIEADMLRMKELKDCIALKEEQRSTQARELADQYVQLGELLLGSAEFDHFCGSYKQQIEVLIPKIRSLEDRLEKLDDKNGANVFSWIGKNAQGMVIRSLLGNSQDSLRRIYETLGEHYTLSEGEVNANGDILALMQAVHNLRKGSSELIREIKDLKAEYRRISGAFGPEGNPVKRIQDMENHIARINGELKILYLRAGSQTEDRFMPLLHEEDKLFLDEIRTIRQTEAHIEVQIEKIKAALTIDDEKAEIEKLAKAVNHHRRRIAASEQAIVSLEERINNANQHIDALSRLL